MPPAATVSDIEAQRRLQPPGTPHRTAKLDPINAIVQDLNERWQLDLPIRDAPHSPSTTVRDRPNKVYNHIKYLYHKSTSALDGVRGEFDRIARIGKEDNIDELLRLLDQATTLCQGRSTKAGRRESLNGAPRNLEEPSNLAPRILREPSKDALKVTPKVTRAASVKKSPQKRQAKIREYLAISKPTENSDGTADSSIFKCISMLYILFVNCLPFLTFSGARDKRMMRVSGTVQDCGFDCVTRMSPPLGWSCAY